MYIYIYTLLSSLSLLNSYNISIIHYTMMMMMVVMMVIIVIIIHMILYIILLLGGMKHPQVW